ncbi:aryl-sulfate sulfotransferase [Winogradskyella vincentii]|uniref:Aryl-sulfate sulfotransferase n=1 Tax=Winogradskyella vincentii TaxID=2877122 RepID=A0ABS7Y5Q9_9FLAO|nr:aryl-sulfate sulfotransferase [Winogradskyella vincentii]MCA0154018.1 aryl-sulfate sulfotransferase [Winogradskyella vincentii]
MLKKLLLLLFLAPFYTFGQNTVGTISITNDVNDGYTLFSVHNKAYLINNCGEVINEWDSAYRPGSSVYLLPNGNLLRAGRLEDGSSDIGFGGQGGIIELFDWDGNIIWSYTYSTNQYRQHHEAHPLPNGNVLILAATVVSGADAIDLGRDPSLLPDNELYNEQLIEVQPILGTTNGNIVWEWNIFDHLIQDFDNTKQNFGNVATSPEKLDINFINNDTGGNNWLHINSVQYNEERDQIVLSARRVSEIWVIDHSTTTAEAATGSGGTYGKGGDLLYRWGNPQAYRQGTETERTLFGQHSAYFIPDGLPNEDKIILFNNGFQRSPEFSQVDIISPPETILGVFDYTPGTAYGPLATDYTYSESGSDPSSLFSVIVSNAQQLPNGNILVCEGNQGYVFELDSNNNKVWEYINPVSNGTGAITEQGEEAAGNLTFRAVKYNPDYPAFIGRDLTPGLPIEINPDLTPCNNLSIEDFDFNTVTLYPNPTKDEVYLNTNEEILKLEVYTTSGQKILQSKSTKISLINYPPGLYLVKVYTSNGQSVKKVIKQ